jgi:predicted nucleic acid-binding protein
MRPDVWRPPGLRSLDAIHVASARLVAHDLAALVTYDRRMLAAAEDLGLPVAALGAPSG